MYFSIIALQRICNPFYFGFMRPLKQTLFSVLNPNPSIDTFVLGDSLLEPSCTENN